MAGACAVFDRYSQRTGAVTRSFKTHSEGGLIVTHQSTNSSANASLTGFPEDVEFAATIGHPRQDEQQIGQTVQIAGDCRIDDLELGKVQDANLGPSADRTGDMQTGSRRGSPG